MYYPKFRPYHDGPSGKGAVTDGCHTCGIVVGVGNYLSS